MLVQDLSQGGSLKMEQGECCWQGKEVLVVESKGWAEGIVGGLEN